MYSKRILAFVITYYPDVTLLKENLHSFSSAIDKVILWDNTPDGDATVKQIALEDDKMIYMTQKENKGISYALNIAWQEACKNGFDYLLTMDQDSVWENFELYLKTALSKDAPKGIYGPEVRTNKFPYQVFEPVDYVITSGMLVPVDILNQVKGYRTDFFVDGIDLEFCLRSKQNNICTYRLSHCRLRQRFGTPKTIALIGHHHTSNYSPIRIKEILKTHIIILRDYPCSFSLKKKIIMTYFLKLPLKILFLESSKRSKFKSYFQGIWEGIQTLRV